MNPRPTVWTHALRLILAICFVSVALLPAFSVQADPVPIPPELPAPPNVFCFRITDIRKTPNDPEGDSFDVEFEVLNWSNQPAGGIQIALNTGTGLGGVIDQAPFFNGADIDVNGRPIGTDSSRPPGNADLANDWMVLSETPFGGEFRTPQTALPSASHVMWAYTDPDTIPQRDAQMTGTPLPSVDLLGPPSLQPGDAALSFMEFTDVTDATSTVIETIDNGPNALDGFVVTIDDWDPSEIVSFNWFLLGEFLFPIGTSAFGNAYGFGIVNLARIDDGAFVFPTVFTGNTGFSQSGVLFFGDVTTITTRSPLAGPEFSGEFGASLTAPFLNPADNFQFTPTNATPIELAKVYIPVAVRE